MRWTYYLGQKLKIAIALTVVIVLVLSTSTINRSHFSKLHASFASVYQDRLIVEGYIFQLSNLLNDRHRRQLEGKLNALDQSYDGGFDKAIQQIISDYENTRFTEEETLLFNKFKNELRLLANLESEYSQGSQAKESLPQIMIQYNELSILLNSLSDLQIKEGKNQIDKSNNIETMSYFLSRIEIVILIVIGLVVQMLIFSSGSLASRFPQDSRLN
jgi:hypothetical protein